MQRFVLLACSMFAEPETAPVPAISPTDWPIARCVIAAQAIEWEILDPREERLLDWEEWSADLRVLRRRYHELKDAPPLADAHRCPDRRTVGELIRANRSLRRWLQARQALEVDRLGWLRETAEETDELHQVWDLIRQAGSEVYYVPVRRLALKRLRQVLGPTAYEAGDWPPHVPWWRFVTEN
ncbi:MAG: hypothetical protein N2039_03000 [Gemmataceae bacterium]|nr:hypothetical protein [Gemmataceae bacterium]